MVVYSQYVREGGIFVNIISEIHGYTAKLAIIMHNQYTLHGSQGFTINTHPTLMADLEDKGWLLQAIHHVAIATVLCVKLTVIRP